MLVVTKKAYNRLTNRTKAELMAAVFSDDTSGHKPTDFDLDFSECVDFSLGEIENLMETLGEQTKSGLQVIAEHGPIIEARLLDATDVDDYASFQRSTTRRTRTITGGKGFMLTWDDWNDYEDGFGHYAVSNTTHKSLRKYFGMD